MTTLLGLVQAIAFDLRRLSLDMAGGSEAVATSCNHREGLQVDSDLDSPISSPCQSLLQSPSPSRRTSPRDTRRFTVAGASNLPDI